MARSYGISRPNWKLESNSLFFSKLAEVADTQAYIRTRTRKIGKYMCVESKDGEELQGLCFQLHKTKQCPFQSSKGIFAQTF